jgi:two-component system sensor histidine kinase KdpD
MHKIFLGYAPGVGKSFAMLDEAARRQSRGQKVAIGVIENPDRGPVAGLVSQFERIAPQVTETPEGPFLSLDVNAIVAARPDLVLVDNLASANPPGAKNAARWQDVREILNAGIHVLSTVNVTALESLNDEVFDITGIRFAPTMPDLAVQEADEVELVDLTPRALINRLLRGDIYPLEAITPAQRALFDEGKLAALREMAMREAARHVDEDVLAYRNEKRVERPWATKDRILICLSPTKASLRLIRRGWRIGNRLHAETEAIYVEEGRLGEREEKILSDDFALCERLGIKTQTLKGAVAKEIVRHARERNATLVILGHSERSKLQELMKPSVLAEVARELETIDLLVVATEVAAPAHT